MRLAIFLVCTFQNRKKYIGARLNFKKKKEKGWRWFSDIVSYLLLKNNAKIGQKLQIRITVVGEQWAIFSGQTEKHSDANENHLEWSIWSIEWVKLLLTQMCQVSGTVLQTRQKKKTFRNKQKLTWVAIVFIHVMNWRGLKSVRAASNFTWHLLHKYSPSLHLGNLLSPVKSLEGEQSAAWAFYTKCKRRPNLQAASNYVIVEMFFIWQNFVAFCFSGASSVVPYDTLTY